jgi:ATP-binding cassette subfamily F protein uup
MALLESCTALSKSFSSRTLFENISLGISEGERLGLIGRNGSGKTTLLKILSGRLEPDSGAVSMRRDTRVGYVPQDAVFPAGKTVAEIIAEPIAAERLEPLERAARINLTLGRAGFTDGSALWLEKLLSTAPFASVVVSHDRYFLDHVVNDMAEIGRVYPEGILRVEGSYSHFLEKKEEFLAAQSSRQEALTNRVRREREWLSRGAKARTGKSKARAEEAGRLIRELSGLESRAEKGPARIDFAATGRRAKRLVTAENVAMEMGGRTLFRNLSFALTPGARLGLLGANGAGKTTLLRILAGELEPSEGRVERAAALRAVYFDQTREQLDATQTLREGLGAHGDTVVFRDRPLHVAGWARRFLFEADQLDRPISSLSGGEQARVLIARLMLQPADLLLLDEPTNDLDIPTLEVLEESLSDFPGALVLVTHDRYLLDRVSNAILGLDGQGGAQLYADYWQWEQAQFVAKPPKPEKPAAAKPETGGRKKLSYLEAREWEGMEARILEAEQAVEALRGEMQSPETVSDGPRLRACYERLQAAEGEVESLYERWAELEGKQP